MWRVSADSPSLAVCHSSGLDHLDFVPLAARLKRPDCAYVDRVKTVYPDMAVVRIAGAGHGAHIGQPIALVDAVFGWLVEPAAC